LVWGKKKTKTKNEKRLPKPHHPPKKGNQNKKKNPTNPKKSMLWQNTKNVAVV